MKNKNFDNIIWSKINSFKENKNSKALSDFRPCPICGSIESKTILNINNFQFYSDSKCDPKLFNIQESICTSCFTLYLNPCYSDYGFNILFSEAGQSYGSSQEHTNEQITWLKDNNLLGENISLLDVGCYEGDFLFQLPDNINKIGVDIDERAIERGRKKNKKDNINFFSGDFETFLYNGLEPDTITMYHVLEHLPRPVKVLKKLRSISKSTTKIVIEVPIIENGNTNDINGFFSIQHTTHFSTNSLLNCIIASGWKIEKIFKVSDYNGYRIVAIPQSKIDEKIVLKGKNDDWAYLSSSLLSWYKAIDDVEKIIQKIPRCERFVIWGGGAHTEYFYQMTSFFHTNAKSNFIIVDSDPIKQRKTWKGLPIYKPSIIKDLDWANTNLIISSYGGQESIAEEANKLGVSNDKITKLYKTIRSY